MIRQGIQHILGWLRRAVTQPREELNRWQKAARFSYELGRHGARQLREDRAPQMAAALSFQTLFGLVPVLLVATILVKAIRGTDALLQMVHDLLISGGLENVRITGPAEVARDSGTAAITLAEWLEDLVSQVANLNLAAIGWVGLAVIIYAAIGLMVTIENSFNSIYRAPQGRPWTRRVPLYWFILTVSPVAVGVASYVNNYFGSWIESVDTWQWLLVTAGILWNFLVGWLMMFAVYTLVPNSAVALRPAVAGSFVAAVLLEVGKHTMGAYLGNAFSISQLYGSLGLVPLFMFWVYLMWLAVLFGLEVSATLQMLQGRSLDEIDQKREWTGIVDPATVITVMEVVAEHFAAAQPVTPRQIADFTSLSEPVTARIINRLIQQRLLHRLDWPDGAVSLAKPPEQMTADEFIDIGFHMADENGFGRRSAMLDRLRDAQRSLTAQTTLAMLVASRPAETRS